MNNECLNMRHERLDEKPCGICEVCIANHEGHETIEIGEGVYKCITCEVKKECDWCGDRAYQVSKSEVIL